MKNILIVDDQLEVRELVEVTLRGDNYKIIQASSGEEALDKIKENPPDLVLLDVMMPGGKDGIEITKIIRSNSAYDAVKIIILSAKGQKADKEMGISAGADSYLVKPFSPLALLNTIDEML